MPKVLKVLAIAATIVLGTVASVPRQGFTEFARFTGFTRVPGFVESPGFAGPVASTVADRPADPIALPKPANAANSVNSEVGNLGTPANPVNLENPVNPGNPGSPANPVVSAVVPSQISTTTATARFEPRAQASASPQTAGTTVAATTPRAIQPWDTAIEQMANDGDLRLQRTTNDPLLPGHAHERFGQYYKGVPVYGGDLSRQTDRGTTVSVFGTIYPDIDLDVTPRLSPNDVRVMVELAHNVVLGPSRTPELLVLPDAGVYRLVYRVVVFSLDGGTEIFIDATTGVTVRERDAVQRQGASAVARGTGVLGDQKKISVMSQAGAFFASDLLRPPSLQTFDLGGVLSKLINFLNGVPLTTSDLATSPSADWSDGAAVDAQAYSGLVYDFYFKRFSRQGLDGNNIPLVNIVHPVPRATTCGNSGNSGFGTYCVNAFYFGGGVMVYGEGATIQFQGRLWNFLAGGLDVVAHELTHGVTDFTSNLIYQNESGALNEAFSDIIGTAVEFYYQPAGTGFLKADYLIGEDVVTPGGLRSMANPFSYGYPDHYSLRVTGPADNGGVHTNSSIVNHAYYLAIEGGNHRLSPFPFVQGVGQANRAQIENVFYRAFAQMMMPSSATFSIARAMTIQAATDLYGAGSTAVQAVTQAWFAVGVN
ncbi:MAG: M4 family metallopeptidase [Vicinamibacterales bacterium]